MSRKSVRRAGVHAVAVGLMGVTAVSVAAQQQARTEQTAAAQIQQRRFEFQLVEAVLVNAVRQGANEVAMRAQMTLPLGTLFMGTPRAKGFPLDGYGIVFDIEIPIILESQVLLSQMAPPRPQSATQPVGNRPGRTGAAGMVAEDPMERSPIAPDPFLADPNAYYRNTVRDKLVNAMLDYSRSLNVPDAEWLSFVARSEEAAPSVHDDSRTLILRIKGQDLAQFHTGKITREEAKKRVVESQF